jgi:uncharacterized membrane protein
MWCMLMHLMGHQSHAGHNAPPASTGAPSDAELLGILKRRYALGEITREQFEEMKRVLGLAGDPSPEPPATGHEHLPGGP